MREKGTNPIVYIIAVFVGVIAEFLGFQVEQLMIVRGIPANIGFPVSLVMFLLIPFISTGLIVYKVTKDYFATVILSTLVIPATLALLKMTGI